MLLIASTNKKIHRRVDGRCLLKCQQWDSAMQHITLSVRSREMPSAHPLLPGLVTVRAKRAIAKAKYVIPTA
jgi:hypothetical protein